MKKLVGGDYLLDLTPIEIEQSEDGATKTNITNADVIAQLTNLKRYVKNPSMIKSVWVRFVNGENDELVVARGTFANVDSGEFEICVAINGYKLRIFIEFTQATLSDNTPIDDWYIATNDAKYLFTSDAQNINALVNAGNIDNTKPIYWHSCTLERITEGEPNVLEYYYDFIIINNSATPFTKDTFMEWLSANASAEIKIVQGYNGGAPNNLMSFFTGDANDRNVIKTHHINTATGEEVVFNQSTIPATFTDNGVNKIN